MNDKAAEILKDFFVNRYQVWTHFRHPRPDVGLAPVEITLNEGPRIIARVLPILELQGIHNISNEPNTKLVDGQNGR